MFNQKPFFEPSVSSVPGNGVATGTARAIFKSLLLSEAEE